MIVTIILSAVIVIQAFLHFIERRDMYNRLMSKDFTEYKHTSSPLQKTHIPSAHSNVLHRWRRKGGEQQ